MFPLHDDRQHALRFKDQPFQASSLRAYAKLFYKDEQADQSAPVEAINRLVEPDGIEPTTSCLQSTRSPN
jgi:hypothetical protein